MASLEELLAKLDLAKFSAKFKEQDIDLEVAKSMSEAELKELGLTVGAAKKLHAALSGGAAAGAAATPAAASPASKPPAAVANVNPFAWKWMFDGHMWPGNASGLMDGAGLQARMFDDAETTTCFAYCTGYVGIDSPVCLWDVEAGQPIAQLKNKVGAHIGADQLGGLVAQVGEQSSYAFWRVPDNKLVHENRTPNGESHMFCALFNSASGAPQLAATDYSFSNVWLFDASTGAPCGKIKATGQSGTALVRDPFNPGTVVFVSNGKADIVDTRAKAIARRLTTTGCGGSFAIPPSSGGKIVCVADDFTFKAQYAVVVDPGTGKVMHKIKAPEDQPLGFRSVAMAGNCVAASLEATDGTGFYFWDINGAGAEIAEPTHYLKYGSPAGALAMSPHYLCAFAISYGVRSFKQ